MASYNVNLLFALACEAQPWIEFLGLKKVGNKPFSHYQGNWQGTWQGDVSKLENSTDITVNLVISGSGQIRMAAATAWLGALTNASSIWLNIGTAGHIDAEIGSVWRIHQVSDSVNKPIYPPMVAKWQSQSKPLETVIIPTSDYPVEAAVDMEAYAFFISAHKFANTELVQALKIISDNAKHTIDGLNAVKVSQLISAQIDACVGLIHAMLSVLLHQVTQSNDEMLISHLRYTESQRIQYHDLMRRLKALGVYQAQEKPNFGNYQTMAQLLNELREQLSKVVPELS